MYFYLFIEVLLIVLVQIEAYRDMIMPVVDAFKYLTQVGLLNLSSWAWVLISSA